MRHMSISALRIRTKLGVVSAMLTVPIVLLAWLFIEQSFKDIRFAEKELHGTAYVRGAWSVVVALIEASSEKTAPASRLKAAPNLAELGRAYDASMETADAARTL